MENKFRKFGTMLDCSRNAVMTVASVKKWIDITADLGYNTVMLYMEDTYEIKDEPYFGHYRGRYSAEELREIDDYAFEKGMEFIPCIQTLAHLNGIFHWNEYKSRIWDCTDILLAKEQGTYDLIDKMFCTFSKNLRTKTINIGMDEAHFLGLGKYLDKYGFMERTKILTDHLNVVSKIAQKYDLELIMWGDMCVRLVNGGEYYVTDFKAPQEVKDSIPHNVNIIHGFAETVDKKKWYERFAFCAKCDPLAFEDLKLFDEPCGVTEPDTIANYNFSKYLLWQDPMLGLFDANVCELSMKEHYSKLAEKMKKYASENAEYRKFFEFYTAAAEALAAKSEIGIRLHKAYLSGNGIEKVKSEISDAINAVKKLHKVHREFWFTVNNPIGWEILDMRYGALLSRLETTILRIEDYLSGKIPNIPELEEKQLYYNGDKNMPQELEYPRIVSACHMEIIK